jgi:hypothetical protein
MLLYGMGFTGVNESLNYFMLGRIMVVLNPGLPKILRVIPVI